MSQNSNSISMVHTPCKKCVFASYNDKTQTGCKLDYLNKMQQHGAEILEAYDDDLEFYIINNKKCVGYRENSWFAKYGLEDSDIDSKIEKFKELNKIQYLLVVNFIQIGSNKSDLDLLEKALSSLTIKPKKMVFIRGSEGQETTIYSTIQSLMTRCKINCEWRIQTMVDTTVSNEDILYNTVNLNKNYRFICDIRKSNCVDSINRLVETANEIVYDNLGQFIVLTDPGLSCMIFGGGVYRYSLIEKGVDILSDPNSFTII